MSLIAIELSDAGIIAASSDGENLLPVDGPDRESPGFALPEKSGLLVGKAAEKKAHLFPRRNVPATRSSTTSSTTQPSTLPVAIQLAEPC